MNKKALFLTISGVLILPAIVSAQITVTSIMTSVIYTAWVIAVGIIIILWIVTGILFLTALGNPSKLTSARTALLTSIAGTAVAILAFSALQLVGNSLGITT
jgi:uncharacterized membrane protein (DUF485 family)